jgi:alpha-L-fucosidase 2
MRLLQKVLFGASLAVCTSHGAGTTPFADSPNRYDVVWNSPSKDEHGSMPLGNGSTGLNAWIEPNGDLVFYISRGDAWGDNGRLLKVGKVRIKLNPAPATDDFLQTLSLVDGTLKARCGDTEFRLWVDANQPVIHAEFNGPKQTEATATIELLRTEKYTLPFVENSDVHMMFDEVRRHYLHAPTVVEPDSLLSKQTGRIGWYHHNAKSVGPDLCAKIQGVDSFKREDPLLHRTFGAVIQARGAKRLDDSNLLSPKSKTHRFDIYVQTKHPATVPEWVAAVDKQIIDTEAVPFEARRASHTAWWTAFWQRSWIHVTAAGGQEGDAFAVSQGYALQRYINACAGRGAYPIKFNGSIFTVAYKDYKGKPTYGGADYRRWGPGYWWQNTRLPYISMCTSGDFEMTDPLYRMYCQDNFEYFKHQTKVHTGHGGIYIPENIYFWGNNFSLTYGPKPFSERTDKLQDSPWHKWEWVSGPELTFMMLDRYEHTLDETFLKDTVIPFANEILIFFDEQYKKGADGKLVMHPAQALETWWECTNPMPEVAGLHAITERLLALPDHLTTHELRTFWQKSKRSFPELPTRVLNGIEMFAPAEKFAKFKNSEVPELYSVFPFRLCAFEKTNVELGLQALNHRGPRGNEGWMQDDIFMAYLGLAEQAKENVVGRAKNKDEGSRFPAFWGPNMDWIPDQDHGGILLKALQSMILQTDGKKIYLMPAWPKDWNAEFKLHAPYKTVIQGRVVNGKLVEMNVTPASRAKDVVLPEAKIHAGISKGNKS